MSKILSIPINIRTQLQNTLSQWKSNNLIQNWGINMTSQIIKSGHAPLRTSTCNLTIAYSHSISPYQLSTVSNIYSTKKEAEKHAVYLCFQKLKQDSQKSKFNVEDSLYCPDCHEYVPEDELFVSSSLTTEYNSSSGNNISNKTRQPSILTSSTLNSDNKTTSRKRVSSFKKSLSKHSIVAPVITFPLFPVQQPNNNYNDNIYILVDLENKPNTRNIEMFAKYNNVKIIKFVGKQHSNRKYGNIIIDSMHRDAVDHAISVYIGGILSSISGDKTIIIYTGDRFGSTVQDFCKNDVLHMAHDIDIIEYIDTKYENEHKDEYLILKKK
jgi:hypothetical protein